ncbi:MAG: zinc ribbon domain-containing protein [Promethearchaeota archaeon]
MVDFPFKSLEPLMWMTLCFISFFVSLYSLFGDWSFVISLILAGFLGGLQSQSSEAGALSGFIAGLLGGVFILIANILIVGLGLTIHVNLAIGEPFLLNYLLSFGFEDIIGTTIIIELAMISMGVFGALGGYLGGQEAAFVFARANQVSFRLQAYCPKCGRVLMSSDRFCSNCGLNLIQMAKLT